MPALTPLSPTRAPARRRTALAVPALLAALLLGAAACSGSGSYSGGGSSAADGAPAAGGGSGESSGADSGAAVAALDSAGTAAAAPAAAPAAVASPSGPVVITANEPAWIQVYERGGRTLFQGELAAGQSYEVPATAAAPLLKTGRPQSLRVAVGTADAPPVGQPDTTVRDVSLKAADLLRGPGTTPAPQSAPAPR